MRKSYVGALLLPLCLSIVACSSKGNLPPPAKLTKLESSIPLKRDWHQVKLDERNRQLHGVDIYADESLFLWVDDQGRLHAQDAQTGKCLWVFELEDAKVTSSAGANSETVVVVTSDAQTIALDKTNGTELWRGKVSSESLVAPQIADGIVIVYCVDGKVFGLNATDGSERWRYNSRVPVISLHGNATPAVADGRVFLGLSEGELVALDLWSGEERWKMPLGVARGRSELDRMVDVDATPVVEDGVVYSAAYQGNVVALKLRTGRMIWSNELSTAQDIAVGDKHVYVVDEESILYALDKKTGHVLWKQDALQWRYVTSPVVYQSYLVVGDLEGYLHWMDSDKGTLVHRIRTDFHHFDAKPVVSDGKLYAMTRTGIIDVLELDNTSSQK